MAEVQKKIDALQVTRNKVAVGIRPDYLKRYGAIRMRRGLAVATVRNGTCLGCNMNVPPQLYNTLHGKYTGDLPVLPPHHLLGGDHES